MSISNNGHINECIHNEYTHCISHFWMIFNIPTDVLSGVCNFI